MALYSLIVLMCRYSLTLSLTHQTNDSGTCRESLSREYDVKPETFAVISNGLSLSY